ncbi:hypothetical protein X798_01467 [Onchocerca flexuosa]|uniref:Uncharacterized protein n=1 Tax=Onchocerca flexuosa TaxID=387005 RepID=A0A238C373_9BILA|nr:hypothetical protein X798_01467 [Onchocerca flexuosa]
MMHLGNALFYSKNAAAGDDLVHPPNNSYLSVRITYHQLLTYANFLASKKPEPKVVGEGGGKKDGPGLQGQPTSTPRPTGAAIPPQPAESEEKKASKKENGTGGAVVAGGKNEEEGGYESCPDMTPEQLAKIANESPAK